MDTHTLVLVPLLAVAAPVLAALVGRVAMVPLVVFEIVLGIVFGPAVLGWVHPAAFLTTLSQIGLALLFFVAGTEIDFASIKGRPLMRAGLGWLISLGAGLAIGFLLAPKGDTAVFIGIALTSTALGAVLPILRDAAELHSPFGKAVTAIGAAGEFGPLLAISLFLSGRAFDWSLAVVVAFAVIAGIAIWIAGRGQHARLHGLVTATLHSSGQFAVRLILAAVAGLVALSIVLGLDMLLGAFAAGILWRVFAAGATPHDREEIETKIEAVAFGFLVPVFFITTGMTFDLAALAVPSTLALVPLFLALLLVVRGLPGLLAAPRGASWADRRAIFLFSATGLPVIVAVTTIGVREGALTTGVSAALVAAGMLSVLLFPLIALAQRRRGLAHSSKLEFPDEDAL